MERKDDGQHPLLVRYPGFEVLAHYQRRFLRHRLLMQAHKKNSSPFYLLPLMAEEIEEMREAREMGSSRETIGMEADDAGVFALPLLKLSYSAWRQVEPVVYRYLDEAYWTLRALGFLGFGSDLARKVIVEKNAPNYPRAFFGGLPTNPGRVGEVYEVARRITKEARYYLAGGRLPPWLDRALLSNGSFPRDNLLPEEQFLLQEMKKALSDLSRIYGIGMLGI